MIRIKLCRSKREETLQSFTLVGHANYAKRGKDIVCAAVSTVSIGSVNSIEILTGVKMKSMVKDGNLSIEVPISLESSLHKDVQLLLSSMVEMLKMVEKEYPKLVRIQTVWV